jgi:eukaryotic-like serine/threonine-protein kinase
MEAMDRLISAKYQLGTEIGRGPHGVVWRARHQGTGEDCAVKVLHQHFASDGAVVDRFVQAEAVLTAFLHPAYVRVRELVIDPEQLALVTEFVDGVDLRRRLDASGPITPRRAAAITAEAALAVAAGHEAGVVHCNIQPRNVILVGEADSVRITDCRVARLARGIGDVGDCVYAAPEVRSGGAPVRATDVYGLGLILHEALTATLPRSASHDAADLVLSRSIDSRLREAIEQCLETNPGDRISAAQLAVDLSQLAGLPGSVLDRAYVAAGGHAPKALTAGHVQPFHVLPEPSPVAADAEQTHARRSRGWLPTGLVLAGVALLVLVIGAMVGAKPRTGDDDSANAVSVPRSAATAAGSLASSDTPEPPSEVGANSAEGATAFVYYWFDTLNHAVQTGDDKGLQAASSPACHTCQAATALIGEGHQDGRSMQGGTYTVRSAQADSFFDLGRPILRVTYDRATRSTLDVNGRIIATMPSITFASCQIVLERFDMQWRVLDVQAASASVL